MTFHSISIDRPSASIWWIATSDSIPNANSAPLDCPGSPQSQSHPKHLQRNPRRNAPYVERWCWGLQVVRRWNGWKKMFKTKNGRFGPVVKIISEKSRWLRELILNVMRRCIEWMHFSASKNETMATFFVPTPTLITAEGNRSDSDGHNGILHLVNDIGPFCRNGLRMGKYWRRKTYLDLNW